MSHKKQIFGMCFFKNNELKSFLVRVVNEKSMANKKQQFLVCFVWFSNLIKNKKDKTYMTCVYF